MVEEGEREQRVANREMENREHARAEETTSACVGIILNASQYHTRVCQ